MKKKLVCGVIGLGLAVAMVACGDAQPEEATAQSTGQSLSIVRASARTRRATGISEWRVGGSSDRLAVSGFDAKSDTARGRFEMRPTASGGVTLNVTQGLSSSTVEISADGKVLVRDRSESPAFMPHLRQDLASATKTGGTTTLSQPLSAMLGRDEEEGAASAETEGMADTKTGGECAVHAAIAALVCALAFESCGGLGVPTPWCPVEATHCLIEVDKAIRACR